MNETSTEIFDRIERERALQVQREREAYERRILDAAIAWAKAERALRTHNYAKPFPCFGGPVAEEEHHRIVLEADYTEQKLLDVVEGR